MTFISVILPTRNRCELLDDALRSISNQSLDMAHFEVLVIDNGSTDNTREVSKRWQTLRSNIRYFYEDKPGLHEGRHRGLVESQGNVLVFADDDIEAQRRWLKTYEELFSDPLVALAGGNNLPMFLEPPPSWLEILWNRRVKNGARSLPALSIQESPDGRYLINPFQVWGCNFAIRKSVLLAAGGFHPDGMPKDLIRFRGDGESYVSGYVNKKNLKCMFDSDASIYHKVTPERMTLDYFYKRGFNQGVSDSYTQLRGDAFHLISRRWSLRKALLFFLRKIKSLCARGCVERQIQHVIEIQKSGYREGFAFHQEVYLNDPEVFEWVHRKQYF